MNKAEEFVSKVLLARDVTHLEHWKTKSYAEHKTLNAFYAAALELIDGFVEQYQGYYNKRMEIERAGGDSQGVAKLLDAQLEWIETNRYEICEKSETALQNTIDEVVALYQSTMYLLTLK